ncbi:MAG: tRNA (guanine-N1)-methyltransferase [Bacteroidetes bacterium]|nr:MAG: tRNA (guanine-N1)-methyltransferase [Bacteroidota bacterium]
MKLKILLLTVSCALYVLPAIAQQNTTTLEEQFVDVIDKSNRYEDYKVVKIYKLNNLKKNVLDSIASIKKDFENAQGTIALQKSEIDTLTRSVASLQTELKTSIENQDGINLLGALIKKTTYKITMWGIIGLLVLVALFLSFKFKNSNAITKVANLKLAETDEEFETHRQRALEREQQLRRKLQDEIIKNKKA